MTEYPSGLRGGSLWDRTPKWLRVLATMAIILYFGGGLLAGTVALLRLP